MIKLKKDKVFFVGEVGINHAGSSDKIKHYIDLASEHGIDAIKLQLGNPSKFTTIENEKRFTIGRQPDSFDEIEFQKVLPLCGGSFVLNCFCSPAFSRWQSYPSTCPKFHCTCMESWSLGTPCPYRPASICSTSLCCLWPSRSMCHPQGTGRVHWRWGG